MVPYDGQSTDEDMLVSGTIAVLETPEGNVAALAPENAEPKTSVTLKSEQPPHNRLNKSIFEKRILVLLYNLDTNFSLIA